MKVALVSPTFFTQDEFLQSPPLGIAYLAAAIRKKNEVKIFFGFQYNTYEDYVNDLKKFNPDIVGFSVVSLLSGRAIEAIKITCKELPDVKIVAGGPHAVAKPDDLVNEVDFLIKKEAEFIFPELINSIESGKGFSKIDSLVWKKKGKVIENEKKACLYDVNKIPWPARDLLPMDYYLKVRPVLPMPYPKLSVISSRGCPYNCRFCQPTVRQLFGKGNRPRDVKDVVDEMEFLVNEYKVKSIQFADDEATADKERTIRLCDEIIRRGLHKKIKWGCASRINFADYEKYKKMKEAGCIYISFGVESGSQEILNYYAKGTTIKQIKKAFEICDKIGIIARANLMIGAPIDTKETVMKTIKLIKEIKTPLVSTSVTTPIVGTYLYEEVVKDGLLDGVAVDKINRFNIKNMKRKFLSDKDIEELMRKVVKEYKRNLFKNYLNPLMWFKRFYFIKALFMFWFTLIRNPSQFMNAMKYYLNYGEKEKLYTESHSK